MTSESTHKNIYIPRSFNSAVAKNNGYLTYCKHENEGISGNGWK
jgi:hypothetical protein